MKGQWIQWKVREYNGKLVDTIDGQRIQRIVRGYNVWLEDTKEG